MKCKVIFSEACVKNSVHWGGGVTRPRPRGEVGGLAGRCLGPDLGGVGGLARGVSRPTPKGSRPTCRGCPGIGLVGPGPHPGVGVGCIPACTEADTPPADGYCCGRYASYWNAFLLKCARMASSCRSDTFR